MQTTGTTSDLHRELLAADASVGVARRAVSRTLQGWGLPHAVDDASLIASELVTNAVRISRSGAVVRLSLTRRPVGVSLAVWDECDALPSARVAASDLAALDAAPDDGDTASLPAFGGWGLPIAQALAHKTWTEPTPPRGKWVCAQLKI